MLTSRTPGIAHRDTKGTLLGRCPACKHHPSHVLCQNSWKSLWSWSRYVSWSSVALCHLLTYRDPFPVFFFTLCKANLPSERNIQECQCPKPCSLQHDLDLEASIDFHPISSLLLSPSLLLCVCGVGGWGGVWVCMCVCVYIHMWASMHVYLCVSVHLCVSATSMRVCIQV